MNTNENLSLSLELTDHQKVVQQVKETADQWERLLDLVEQYNQVVSGISGMPAFSLSGIGSTAGTFSNNPTQNVSPVAIAESAARRTASDATQVFKPVWEEAMRLPAMQTPYSRLHRLESLNERFTAEGGDPNSSYGRDLALILSRAEKAVNKIENPSDGGGWQSSVAKLIMSSRFGVGGAMPLVNKALGVFGIGEEQVETALKSPLGLAATAAAAAATALYKLAEGAADVNTGFTNLKYVSGGTDQETNQLRALGISGAEARGLNDRIASDPVAAAYAQRFGAYSVPGPYGTLDAAQNQLKILKGLRDLPDEEQRRALRVLHMEDQAPLLKVSDQTFNSLMDESSPMTEESQKAAAEFMVKQKRFERAWQNFTTAFGNAFLDPASAFMEYLTNGLNPQVAGAYLNGGSPKGASLPTLEAPPTQALDSPSAERMERSKDLLGENSRALMENTAAMSRLTHAIGGGERARAALPANLTGMRGRGSALLTGYRSGALRLGGI